MALLPKRAVLRRTAWPPRALSAADVEAARLPLGVESAPNLARFLVAAAPRMRPPSGGGGGGPPPLRVADLVEAYRGSSLAGQGVLLSPNPEDAAALSGRSSLRSSLSGGGGGGNGGGVSASAAAAADAATAATIPSAATVGVGNSAFFVPYLSAVQLFVPEPDDDGDNAPDRAAGAGDDDDSGDLGAEAARLAREAVAAAGRAARRCESGAAAAGEDWPRRMRLVLGHVEADLPFHREPLYHRLCALLASASASSDAAAAAAAAAAPLLATSSSPPPSPGPMLAAQLQLEQHQQRQAAVAAAAAAAAADDADPAAAAAAAAAQAEEDEERDPGARERAAALATPLARLPLAALHPASWFAVAWYPACRLPDAGAQLTSRFLTFHSLAALSPLANAAADVAVTGAPPAEPWSPTPGARTLPVVGLLWNNLQDEAAEWLGPVADAGRDAGAAAAPSSAGGPPAAPASTSSSSLLLQSVSDLRAALHELRGTAARLATGSGILVEQQQQQGGAAAVMREQRLHVPDYDFFERTSSS